MDYKGYHIEEERPGEFMIYRSYEDWRDGKESMYTASSLSEAEQWVDRRTPEVTPVTPREGLCYQLAWQHINEQGEGTLIHAEIWSANLSRMIGHALVETETGYIYEPVSDRYFVKEPFYRTHKIKEVARYSLEQAGIMVLKHNNYGPWETSPTKGE
jgi:hypothetical protein